MKLWSLLLLPLSLSTASLAQISVRPLAPPQTAAVALPPGAASLLAQAQAAVQTARTTAEAPSPDSPNWRVAIALGEEARDAAPTNPIVLRFLGETYSAVSWDSRAWETWGAYLEAGGREDAAVRRALGTAGQRLGYARYSAGNLEGAAEVFGRVLELTPEDPAALTWLGRIALESGRSLEAQEYWERVLALRPGNRAARYYLGRAQQQQTFGADASRAFNDGLAAYSANQKAEALEAFSRAAEASPEFEEAFSWAGRVALELGRPVEAKTFWSALLRRDPENRQAGYFLGLAESQERWGSSAGRAFYSGQELYNQGQISGAAEAFVRASESNPQYPAAASWAARSLQESGQTGRAVLFWRRVVALNPDDPSATFFLEAAQAQQNVSDDAVGAFNSGVQAYQEAELGAAAVAFSEATERDPSYADAWGWSGRLAFEEGRFAEAEDAYARAAELEPDNSSYSFFLDEAKRLGAQE